MSSGPKVERWVSGNLCPDPPSPTPLQEIIDVIDDGPPALNRAGRAKLELIEDQRRALLGCQLCGRLRPGTSRADPLVTCQVCADRDCVGRTAVAV
jgi:hypothetical protein